MNEELLDTEGLPAPPINLAKSTDKDLKNIPINSSNAAAVTGEMLNRDDRVMVKINSTERDKHAVFVGINGRNWNIPRDVWCKVPRAVLGVLDNAKIREYSVKADPTKSAQAEVTSTEVSRFAVSSKPVETPAEAAAPVVAKK